MTDLQFASLRHEISHNVHAVRDPLTPAALMECCKLAADKSALSSAIYQMCVAEQLARHPAPEGSGKGVRWVYGPGKVKLGAEDDELSAGGGRYQAQKPWPPAWPQAGREAAEKDHEKAHQAGAKSAAQECKTASARRAARGGRSAVAFRPGRNPHRVPLGAHQRRGIPAARHASRDPEARRAGARRFRANAGCRGGVRHETA